MLDFTIHCRFLNQPVQIKYTADLTVHLEILYYTLGNWDVILFGTLFWEYSGAAEDGAFCPAIRNSLSEVTLCFIDLAGTPATISSSGISCITKAPAPTITLFPIFILFFNVLFSPVQQVSPKVVLPPIIVPAVSSQFLPITTL